jgi:hypothetical protein
VSITFLTELLQQISQWQIAIQIVDDIYVCHCVILPIKPDSISRDKFNVLKNIR